MRMPVAANVPSATRSKESVPGNRPIDENMLKADFEPYDILLIRTAESRGSLQDF
jgi:hypothetical protein